MVEEQNELDVLDTAVGREQLRRSDRRSRVLKWEKLGYSGEGR